MAPQNNHKSFLKDPLPERIYFDTNFIVNALFAGKSNRYTSLACRYFVERLLKNKTEIYFSSIIFPEFWHAVLKLSTTTIYKLKTERELYEKLKKEKKEIVKSVYPEIRSRQRQFDELMERFNKNKQLVYVIETEKVIMIEAEEHMKEYGLMSYDAIHLASATVNISKARYKKPPIFDIVTIDSDFKSIEDDKFFFWCKGCGHQEILKYEKTLKRDELFEDAIILDN